MGCSSQCLKEGSGWSYFPPERIHSMVQQAARVGAVCLNPIKDSGDSSLSCGEAWSTLMHPLLKIPTESLQHLQRAASWSVPDFQFSSPQQRKTAKNSTLFSSCFSWLLILSFYMTKIHQVLQRENHQLSGSLLCTSLFFWNLGFWNPGWSGSPTVQVLFPQNYKTAESCDTFLLLWVSQPLCQCQGSPDAKRRKAAFRMLGSLQWASLLSGCTVRHEGS